MALFKYSVIGILLSVGLCEGTYAQTLQVGNPNAEYGEFTLSGFLRAKYQDKSWSDNDHKLSFDVAKINLDYKKDNAFAHVEYRCYQFNKLCDFSSLVDGYVGYQFSGKNQIKLGVQTIPFGPTRFWESNYYGGINTQFGLEDVHNLGLNYQFEPVKNTQINIGFFPTDAASYHGSSVDAARYSANFVEPNDPTMTYLQERNMWIGRIQQHLDFLDEYKINASVGASYWYSKIKNKTDHVNGQRNAWSAFGNIAYDNLNFNLVFGQNHVKNKDIENPTSSLMGAFDDNYWIANKGDFYTADIRYSFKDIGKLGTITPYAMYSSFIKDTAVFKNSTRNIVGVSLDHNNMTLLAEYIMGKNDFLIGGDEYSYADGNSLKTEKLLNFQLIYNF